MAATSTMDFDVDLRAITKVPLASWGVEVEVELAKALAAAANVDLPSSHHVVSDTSRMHLLVRLNFVMTSKEQTGEEEVWGRQDQDDVLRCIDRSLGRIYPRLDPQQLLSASSPSFNPGRTPGTRRVQVELYPTSAFAPERRWAAKQKPMHLVEGEPVNVWVYTNHSNSTGVSGTIATSHDEVGQEGGIQPGQVEAAQDDGAYWERVRAVRFEGQRQGTATSAIERTLEQQQQQRDWWGGGHAEEGTSRRHQWRLCSWLAERMVNESSWAAWAAARGAGKSADRAKLPRHATVLDAVQHELKAGGRRGPATRMQHVDVRGLEFTAAIVGLTGRYAYCAVPMADGLSCVCRLPIPSWMAHHVASSSSRPQKRPRAEPTEERNVLHNQSEALRHDNSSTLKLLAEEERRLVTIRAHLVLCYPSSPMANSPSASSSSSSPYALWLDDVGIISTHPSTATSTFGDLVWMVKESCRRFLERRAAFEAFYASTSAAESAQPAAVAAGSTVSNDAEKKEEDEEGNGDDDTSSTGAVANDGEEVSASPVVEPLPSSSAAKQVGSKAPLAKADALLAWCVDTMNVRFGKKGRGGSAGCPITIRTSREAAGLRESAMVELKYALQPKAAAGTYVMDTERLRNTIAAMASTLGGVVIVGMTDEGQVVGHAPRQVLDGLRTSGFCPAMVKDGVSVRELPVLQESATPRLPPGWWKQQPGSGVGATPSALASGEGSPSQKVVTVVAVTRGQAPFYRSGRTSLPYWRLCASTVPMSVVSMATRLLNFCD